MEEAKETGKYSTTHDQFAFEIAFNHVCYLIENKSNLNNNSEIRIEQAKQYFQSAKTSLDSIVKSGYEYSSQTPYLKEIIKYCGKDISKISSKDVNELKGELSSVLNKLDNLKKNPQEFYKTDDSEELFGFLTGLMPFRI
ncbi:MAG: hypothetical protein NTZ83_04425 [Candidatus Pacearchaeota archaeon]|nr:hypothetical protein [Candidatus Pacearchaeota archaeon]